MNDLLENLSALRLSVQHISARLPSPLLSIVDFASWNPVECNVPNCRIGRELMQPETSYPDKAQISLNVRLASTANWQDIQQSCPVLRCMHALLQSREPPPKLGHPLPCQFSPRFSCQYLILDIKNVLQSVYNVCAGPCQSTLAIVLLSFDAAEQASTQQLK